MFYISLTSKKISDEDYVRVFEVWDKFEMRTIKDRDSLLVKCNVLLLSDVLEKFRNSSLKNYELCRSYYLSAPALSWEGNLKMKEKLNLF